MKAIKKIITMSLVAFFSMGICFAKEELDENLRFELNVSDSLFTKIICSGNMTDIALDITSVNNKVGGRIGIIARETFFSDKDNTLGFNFTLNPYIGFNFFGGCIMGGVTFYPGTGTGMTSGVSPYIGFNWDFDIIPIKNGLSHSMAIRVGTDWHFSVINSKDAATAIFGTLFSVILPNFSVGVTYKFGYGQKVGNKKAAENQIKPVPITDETQNLQAGDSENNESSNVPPESADKNTVLEQENSSGEEKSSDELEVLFN